VRQRDFRNGIEKEERRGGNMKSRVAVSLLFVLIAATLASEATAAFKNVRSWMGKGCDRRTIAVENHFTSPSSAPMRAIPGGDEGRVMMIHLNGDHKLLSRSCANGSQPCVVGTISPDGKTITLNSLGDNNVPSSREGNIQGRVFKLVGSDSRTDRFGAITTAVKQIREVFDLIRLK
jgi:hypothetical protein